MADYDAIIIGAGAAGLMAAMTAGQRGRRVLLLDHADRVGAKILISGGGRCNFTNLSGGDHSRYYSANPHFARSALSRYTPADFLALVEAHDIAWHEKTLGQLFCDGSAKQIVKLLTEACDAAGVDMRTSQRISNIEHGAGFTVTTPREAFTTPKLVIATGGPSIPKMGATGFAYDVARRFGLKVIEPRPALVPVTLGEADARFAPLAGVAFEAIAQGSGPAFREAALFTHRGLSGPAILQASSRWARGDVMTLDFLPGTDAAALLLAAKRERPRAGLKALLAEQLPDRLATTLAAELAIAGGLADATDRKLGEAGARLNRWPFHPTGTEGFAKAEVTIGGVDTAGLSSKTMAANGVPGLHFIGEAVDVTGWLGGYNFQWAWASGWCAAQVL